MRSPQRRFAPAVTLLASIVAFLGSLRVLWTLRFGGAIAVAPGWVEVDTLGAFLLVLIAFVFLTASLFSWGYLGAEQHGERRSRLYHANFNLFAFSMLCIPVLNELGLVWIFVELTTLLSVLLVSYALTSEAVEAAWKYMILTLLGATIAVLGIFVLFWTLHTTGSTDFTWSGLRAAAPHMNHALLSTAFALLLVGYGAKIGLVPLHSWLLTRTVKRRLRCARCFPASKQARYCTCSYGCGMSSRAIPRYTSAFGSPSPG